MATIAAAAIAAGGSAYAANKQSQTAGKAAKAANAPHTIHLPPYAEATDRYAAQLAVLNATVQPPSFQDWVGSGGQATFPLRDPGLTPQMEQSLGLVNKHGQRIPTVPAGTEGLSPEQLLYLGMQHYYGSGGAHSAKPHTGLAAIFEQWQKTMNRYTKQQRQNQKNNSRETPTPPRPVQKEPK